MKRFLSILFCMLWLLQMVGCRQSEIRQKASFLVFFDTVTEVVAYTKSTDEFKEFSQLAYDNLKEYHELFDIYHNYDGKNNIKTINDNAGIKPVKVDKKIIDLLQFSKKAFTETDGKVNVAFGSVLKIWHKYRTEGIEDPENASLPPKKLLIEAEKHVDMEKVIIDQKNSTVYLEDPQMSLDVGAIAKGYATEQVTKILKQSGYTSFLLSVGGNVRAVGNKGSNGESWVVGIQNPQKEAKDSTLYNLNLKDLSLVTSGNYQRYYTVKGKQYHHIIDPKTLEPASFFTAVSIICEDSGLADALSTAIYNMPLEEGKALIETIDNTEAIWILANGKVAYSDGFQQLIKE